MEYDLNQMLGMGFASIASFLIGVGIHAMELYRARTELAKAKAEIRRLTQGLRTTYDGLKKLLEGHTLTGPNRAAKARPLAQLSEKEEKIKGKK